MKPTALWLPLEVASLDRALEFYTAELGLSPVDRWERDGERGVVLRVPGPALVELVQPAPSAAEPRVALALEVSTDAAVDGTAARLGAGRPERFPRGHYGVTVRDPDGTPILVWSEG